MTPVNTLAHDQIYYWHDFTNKVLYLSIQFDGFVTYSLFKEDFINKTFSRCSFDKEITAKVGPIQPRTHDI